MKTRKTFRNGDLVRVGTSERIPMRYQGRTAEVVGREKTGQTVRFLVSFGERRRSPLAIPATQLSLI